MKAVIMAAGKSTRTYPLTLTRPKPLLPVAGKTIIERNLGELKGIVDEVIIIVGYKKEMLMEHVGMEYMGLKITYAIQKEQHGTGHAVLQTERFVDDRFIVMNGDDLFSGKDIRKLLSHDNAALAVHKDDNCQFGLCIVEGGNLREIIEKPEQEQPGLCNVGCYIFETGVFDILRKLKKSPRGEIELTDAVTAIAKKKRFAIEKITDFWLPISYPWNLLEANSHFLKNIKTDIKGTVEKGATIKGEAIIGKGTVVKNCTYIEGPVMIGEDCVIGPSAYIRPDTTIGDRCKFRGEAYDAIIMDESVAKHHCYIGHSVLGVDVNIGAGTITSDYRHDGKNNITIVNGKKVDSGRRKLGSFMGDHVRTGINTCIYPGRKLWPNTGTLPGEIVKKDITEAETGKK